MYQVPGSSENSISTKIESALAPDKVVAAFFKILPLIIDTDWPGIDKLGEFGLAVNVKSAIFTGDFKFKRPT